MSDTTPLAIAQDEERIITEVVRWLGLEEREGLLSARDETMPPSWKNILNIDRLCSACSSIPWHKIRGDEDSHERRPWPKIVVQDSHLTLRQTILNANSGCHFCATVLINTEANKGPARWPRRADAEKRRTKKWHNPKKEYADDYELHGDKEYGKNLFQSLRRITWTAKYADSAAQARRYQPYVSAAALWLIYAAGALFYCCDRTLYAFGSPWKPPSWESWKEKFRELVDHMRFTEFTRNLVRQALESMNQLEQGG
ncbi:hypothetical protein VTL71DRAFT_10402 [Oculimacula yallundae]|uniref:Uncharacterized protein n=1 Tax=Oculimacula yallundae TaxID=86028 RepID=A0ABR4CTH4_9HELO